jgi:hydrogenase expression/formation protein HypE
MVAAMIEECGKSIHVLRDPTRGGVGTTLNELAQSSGVGIRIRETDLPVRDDVRGACELLGLDPLYLANEGKLLIGEVVAEHPGQVVMQTSIGSSRIVDMLHGEPLPRIC